MQVTAKILDNPFEGWTTIEEIADMIGRDKTTVHSWAKRGLISCFQVGRKMRVVNIEEVREFAEKHPSPRYRTVDKTATME